MKGQHIGTGGMGIQRDFVGGENLIEGAAGEGPVAGEAEGAERAPRAPLA